MDTRAFGGLVYAWGDNRSGQIGLDGGRKELSEFRRPLFAVQRESCLGFAGPVVVLVLHISSGDLPNLDKFGAAVHRRCLASESIFFDDAVAPLASAFSFCDAGFEFA